MERLLALLIPLEFWLIAAIIDWSCVLGKVFHEFSIVTDKLYERERLFLRGWPWPTRGRSQLMGVHFDGFIGQDKSQNWNCLACQHAFLWLQLEPADGQSMQHICEIFQKFRPTPAHHDHVI